MAAAALPGPLAPTRSPSRTAAAAALAAVLPMVLLALPALRGEVYLAGDLGHFHLPLRHLYQSALVAGDRLDWTPALWCGFDLLGEGQGGFLHPLHFALYRLLPLDVAFDVEVLLPHVLGLAGTSLFLRRRRIPLDAAFLGGLLYAYGGFFLFQRVHPVILTPLAHIPWNLLAIDGLGSEGKSGRRAIAALAALTASQSLYGHPQAIALSLLAEVLFLCSPIASRPIRRVATAFALAKALGLAAAGVQILATFEAYRASARVAAPSEFVDAFSLRPRDLLQLLGPYLFEGRSPGLYPHESVSYAGAVPLVLLAWVTIRWRGGLFPKPFALACFAVGGLALVLAFGPAGWLHSLLRGIPGIGSFRAPARARVLLQFSLSAVSAVAFADLVQAHRQGLIPWRRLRPLALAPAASLALAALALVRRDAFESATGAPLSGAGGILLGPACLAGAAALVALAARGHRLAAAAIPLFAAADCAAYGLVDVPHTSSRSLDAWVASIAPPPGPPTDRVVTRGGNEIVLRGYRLADGYAGLPPQLRLDWTDPAVHRIAGVRWVRRNRADPPEFAGRFRAWDERWYEISDPLPRARFVTRAVVGDRPAADLSRIDPEREALVERPLALEGETPGTAAIVGDRPGLVRIRTDVASTQLLVLAERFQEGWQASLDGEAAAVERVNGEFLGCRVPAGAREALFEYRPRSRRAALAVSIAAAAAIAILAVASYTPQSSRKLQRRQLVG